MVTGPLLMSKEPFSFKLLQKQLTIRSSLLLLQAQTEILHLKLRRKSYTELQHTKLIRTAHWNNKLWGKHKLWSCCLKCVGSFVRHYHPLSPDSTEAFDGFNRARYLFTYLKLLLSTKLINDQCYESCQCVNNPSFKYHIILIHSKW